MKNIETFEDFGLSAEMMESLKKKGFEIPSTIQKQVIPVLLESDNDLVGQAQTGTGKTAAFGIPILEKIKENSKKVQVLILVPTRELAIQVSEEINSFKGKKNFQIIPVYGGQSIEQQLFKLKRGVDIVVGTPGRIIDHLNRKSLNVSAVSYVVLDEADEMLNMGFIDDVKEILSKTNKDRTTLLFSATMPQEILSVAEKHMKDYVKLRADENKVTTDLTDQIYFEVPASGKFEALCRIIDMEDEFFGLIFCRTKVDVDDISKHLIDRGYSAEGLHGDISQHSREMILNKFRKKRINILVATDVAARGIDIQNLTHVINYSIPQDPDSYVHRIGRTGRAGKEGTAVTFITPEEYRKLMYIKKMAKTDIRKQKVPKLSELMDVKRSRIVKEIKGLSDIEINTEFINLADELFENNDPKIIVASLLQYCFKEQLDPGNYNEIKEEYPQIKNKTRLFIARGKKDFKTKRNLVDFIKTNSKVDDRYINDVQLFDTFSFITVPFREAEKILESFKHTNRGKGSVVTVAKPDKNRNNK